MRYIFLVTLFLFNVYSFAQSNDSTLRKMDVSLTYSFNSYSNLSSPNGVVYSSFQVLNTVYPFAYKSSQFGIGFGYEYVGSKDYTFKKDSTLRFSEDRIPLLLSYKLGFSKTIFKYFKYQFGTALILSSNTQVKDGEQFKNLRKQIGLPILFQMAIGIQMYDSEKLGVGLELGYSYKQLGFKNVPEFNPNSISFGLVAVM